MYSVRPKQIRAPLFLLWVQSGFVLVQGLLITNIKRKMYDDLDANRGVSPADMKHQYRSTEVGTSGGFSFDPQAANKKYISNSLYYGYVLAAIGLLFLVAGFYLY